MSLAIIKNEPIEYRSLSDIVADKLRDAIITGQLQPGAKVTENAIAETMGVSRVVVREAILMLIRQNLLEKERNKFTRVVNIERKDIADIFDLRIAVEQSAAKRCIASDRFASEVLSTLTQKSNQIESLSSSGTAEPREMMYVDMGFHDYFVRSADNPRLLSVWEELSGPMFLLLYRYILAGFALHYRHDNLIDAFKTMDLITMYGAIEEHILDTKLALMNNC